MEASYSVSWQVVLLLLLLFCCGFSTSSDLVSNVLGSHMVLQRAPFRAHLWGTSNTSATVSVTFNNNVFTTQTKSNGEWDLFLDPTPPGGPYTIRVSSSSGEEDTLEDVLFGDVFLCGGQSNMQFTVESAYNSTLEIKAAANFPNIRVFTAGTKSQSTTPLPELDTILQPWTRASPSSIGMGNWTAFSAVCWFFGRDLYLHLNGEVPIGLFSDNYGGTTVQTWTSPEGVAKCNLNDSSPRGPHDPSLLWNAMIVPALPLTLRGALWYQGESNADNADYYACAFPAMISDWRSHWSGDNKEFPFLFVQLAPWFESMGSGNPSEARIRLAQMFAMDLPLVGYATAMDLGDPLCPFGSIHPRLKQQVGYRLTLAARNIIYKEPVQYKGPTAKSFNVLSYNPLRIEVTFDLETVGAGLFEKDFRCPSPVPSNYCAAFEVGYGKETWVPAEATISSNNTLVITAAIPSSAKVNGVRYGWAEYPLATLYNAKGLPALPFAFPNPIVPATTTTTITTVIT